MGAHHYNCIAMIVLGCLSFSVIAAADAAPLSSYMLMADEVVMRGQGEADTIFFSDDVKKVGEKMKELGVTFPNAVAAPRGSLFVVALSDYTDQAFAGMSAEGAGPTYVLDLERDEDESARRGGAVPKGKKRSRLLLVACPPARGIKGWTIKTADGKRHEVKGTELK